MENCCGKKNPIGKFFKNFFEKLDKNLKEKAQQKSCCEKGKEKKDSCCK